MKPIFISTVLLFALNSFGQITLNGAKNNTVKEVRTSTKEVQQKYSLEFTNTVEEKDTSTKTSKYIVDSKNNVVNLEETDNNKNTEKKSVAVKNSVPKTTSTLNLSKISEENKTAKPSSTGVKLVDSNTKTSTRGAFPINVKAIKRKEKIESQNEIEINIPAKKLSDNSTKTQNNNYDVNFTNIVEEESNVKTETIISTNTPNYNKSEVSKTIISTNNVPIKIVDANLSQADYNSNSNSATQNTETTINAYQTNSNVPIKIVDASLSQADYNSNSNTETQNTETTINAYQTNSNVPIKIVDATNSYATNNNINNIKIESDNTIKVRQGTNTSKALEINIPATKLTDYTSESEKKEYNVNFTNSFEEEKIETSEATIIDNGNKYDNSNITKTYTTKNNVPIKVVDANTPSDNQINTNSYSDETVAIKIVDAETEAPEVLDNYNYENSLGSTNIPNESNTENISNIEGTTINESYTEIVGIIKNNPNLQENNTNSTIESKTETSIPPEIEIVSSNPNIIIKTSDPKIIAKEISKQSNTIKSSEEEPLNTQSSTKASTVETATILETVSESESPNINTVSDVDSDGVPDNIDIEPFTPFGAAVDEKGRGLDSDNDGVADIIDLEKNSPLGIRVDERGRSIMNTRKSLKFDPLLFDENSKQIAKKDYALFYKILRYTEAYPSSVVEIVGFIADPSEKKFNVELTKQRTEEAYRVLVEVFKVPAKNLTTNFKLLDYDKLINARKKAKAKKDATDPNNRKIEFRVIQ